MVIQFREWWMGREELGEGLYNSVVGVAKYAYANALMCWLWLRRGTFG